MGAHESHEALDELVTLEAAILGAPEAKELETPRRPAHQRRSRSEPPQGALSPRQIHLELSPLRPPQRVRTVSTTNLFDEDQYAPSVREVLLSKFVLIQVLFNVVASVVGPIIMFALMFAVLDQGPYQALGPELVGVGWGSLILSPLLIFALMPVAMPEAVEMGWFKPIKLETCGRWRLVLPYLGIGRCWRWAPLRHLCLGAIVGLVYFPALLVIAKFVMGPTLSTRTLIWFLVCYTGALAPPITALGCLGYAVEHNLAPTIGMMLPHKNPCVRTLKRVLASIKMYLCPLYAEPDGDLRHAPGGLRPPV